MRIHRELHSERPEGEDAGVKHNAQRHDVPVGNAELKQVLEDDLVSRSRLTHCEMVLGVHVHDPVDDRPNDAQRAHTNADKKWVPPIDVGSFGPAWGVQRRERTDAANRKVDPEGETQFLTLEPGSEGGGDRHNQRLSSHTEDQSSGSHDPQIAW